MELANIVMMLLKALWRIVHSPEKDAHDIASRAFQHGWQELDKWQKKKGK